MTRFFKKYCGGEKKLFIKSFVFLFVTSMTGTLYGYLIGLAIDKALILTLPVPAGTLTS